MATDEKISAPPGRYDALAQAFDEIAAAQPEPRRPARGYHRLIEAVHRSIVRPGASVLEIGSGGGDLLAAVEPARGVGIDVSDRHGRARPRAPSRASGSSRPRARTSRSARPSTTSSSPTSSRTSTTCSRSSRTSPTTRPPRRGSSSTPTASSGARRSRCSSRSRLKQRTPVRNWLTIGDVEEPPAARRARAGDDDAADPLPAADPVPLGVPERVPRAAADRPPPLPDVLDRRAEAAARRAARS